MGLPGQFFCVPKAGRMCDTHPTTPAFAIMQGETDSFGAEYHAVCAGCYDKWEKREAAALEELRPCDWCHKLRTQIKPFRDYDEGTHGPVYYVCKPCRDKYNLAQKTNEPYKHEHWNVP